MRPNKVVDIEAPLVGHNIFGVYFTIHDEHLHKSSIMNDNKIEETTPTYLANVRDLEHLFVVKSLL